MTVKAGIIGFNYMGRFHLNKARDSGITITAVHDLIAQRRAEAEQMGLKAYDKLEDFLKDPQIDLVFICTPNQVHARLSKAALQAGKNVVCEKPVAMNSSETEEILLEASHSRKVFTVHQNRRWDADYLKVKKAVDSGILGNITMIRSQVFLQRAVCYGWRADPEFGGGMLYDWGIHQIDQLLCLFEGHKVVRIYAGLQSILTPVVDDCFELQMVFDNGTSVWINSGVFSLLPQPRWIVFGDRGTLQIDDFSGEKGSISRIREGVDGFDSVFGKQITEPKTDLEPLKPEQTEVLPLPEVNADPLAFHRNLARSAEGLEKPVVTPDQVLRSMRVLDTAFESSRLKQAILTEI